MDLNEQTAKAAVAGDTLNDKQVKGLSLRCFPSGKVFYFYYRINGVQRRPKIGRFGDITLTQARTIAKNIRGSVALGRDPMAEREAARNAPTVGDLWEEYNQRHASHLKSGSMYARLWRIHLAPTFAGKKVKDVTFKDVADFHAGLSHIPIEANRTLALLSAMMNFACRPLEWIDRTPVRGVKRFKEIKRRRYMVGEEAARIAEILNANRDDNPASVAFIYLLILTGARRGEIAAARWEWLQGNVIRLPDSKTGAKSLYLPEPAMDVIARLPRTNGTITGIVSPTKFWQRVREEAGCPDLRLHDLRHSFASAALSAGLSLAQIGELLGHKSTQTTHRYAHLVEEAASAAATAAADKIMLTMKKIGPAPHGDKGGAKVATGEEVPAARG